MSFHSTRDLFQRGLLILHVAFFSIDQSDWFGEGASSAGGVLCYRRFYSFYADVTEERIKKRVGSERLKTAAFSKVKRKTDCCSVREIKNDSQENKKLWGLSSLLHLIPFEHYNLF